MTTRGEVAQLTPSVLDFLRANSAGKDNATMASRRAAYVQCIAVLMPHFNDRNARLLKARGAREFSIPVPPALEKQAKVLLDAFSVKYRAYAVEVASNGDIVKIATSGTIVIDRRGNLDSHARLASFLAGDDVPMPAPEVAAKVEPPCACDGCTYNVKGYY